MSETFTQEVQDAIESQTFEEPLLNRARNKFNQLESETQREPDQEKEHKMLKKYLEAADNFRNNKATDKTDTQAIAKNQTEELKQEADLSKHTKNLNKISEKIEKALEDGRLKSNTFTWGELDFMKYGDEINSAVIIYTTEGSTIYKRPELKAKLDELFVNVGLGIKAYNNTLEIDGHVHGKEVKHFLDRVYGFAGKVGALDMLEKPEIQKANELREKVINATPAGLLEMYEKEPKDEKMNRSIIVHELMKAHINVSGFTLIKGEKGKYTLGIEEGESSDQKTKREPLQAVLDKIEPNYIDGYRMNATLGNIEFGIDKEVSPRNIANTIIKKYEIKYDGGDAKYEDLLDDDRKKALTDSINTKIKEAKTSEEKQDLQYLLDLGEVKEKEFMADAKLVGNFKLISSDYLEDGDIWKLLGVGEDGRGNAEKIIETILTGNGGMNMIFILMASVYAMFKGKGKHVFLGAGALLGIQTLEENFSGSGVQKKIVDFLGEVSPEMGKMAEGLWNKTPFGKPQFEVGFIASEYEGTYKNLYQKNAKKLEEGKLSDSMAEEDFAQIYGQLLANNTFRSSNIENISKATESEGFPNFQIQGQESESIFGDKKINTYEEGLIKNNDEDGDTLKDRKITQDKVKLVIKSLIKNRDTQGDITGADLFAQGKAEGLTIAGGEDFQTENKAISDAFANISPKNPERETVKKILDISNVWWKPENIKILFGIDGTQAGQIDTMITNLTGVAAVLTGTNKTEISTLVEQLTGLKDKSVALEAKEKYINEAFDGADARLFGAEGIFKDSADLVAFGTVSALRNLGFEQVALPQMGKIDILTINEKIEAGKELLGDPKDEKIADAIKMLQRYKIEITKQDGGDVAGARLEFMETNSESILEELDGMEGSMNKLALSNIPDLDGYYRVLMENVGNIAILREYAGVNTSPFDKANEVKKMAVALLKNLDAFSAKITNHKQRFFEQITFPPYTSMDYAIASADINSIEAIQKSYDTTRSKLLDENIVTSVKGSVRGAVNWFDGVNLENVEKNKLVILSKILGDASLAQGAEEYEINIKQLGKDIDDRREVLDTNKEKERGQKFKTALDSLPSIYSHAENQKFIKTIEDNIRPFVKSDLQAKKLESEVEEYVESMIVAITDDNLDEILRDFKKIKTNIGSGDIFPDDSWENRFELIYNDKLEQISKTKTLNIVLSSNEGQFIIKDSGLADFMSTYSISYFPNITLNTLTLGNIKDLQRTLRHFRDNVANDVGDKDAFLESLGKVENHVNDQILKLQGKFFEQFTN